jgi:hypothetical protein
MGMRRPAVAIAWQIWHQSRVGFVGLIALLVSFGVANWVWLRHGHHAELAKTAGYIVLPLALLLTLFGFHFTEGQRKGGFGSFPTRLFILPVSTAILVGLPMLYGAVSVLLVYVALCRFVFAPLGIMFPLLWPALYLVASLAVFQTIVWTIPERRYLKLLCLGSAAAGIGLAWMFFLPHILEGTLSELGYEGSVRVFRNTLFGILCLVGPGAYLFNVWSVQRQRHGGRPFDFGTGSILQSIIPRRRVCRRPFGSLHRALLWYDWRRTGLILPVTVAVVLVLTCVPAVLSGPLSSEATTRLVVWLVIAPVALAGVIGRGFCKFDFWSADLRMTPYAAVRPVSPGQWVATRLMVALLSVVLTWMVVALALWGSLGVAGDEAVVSRFQEVLSRYTGLRLAMATGFGVVLLLVLTWRFLISGLATGLWARRTWYFTSNTIYAVVLLSLFFAAIWWSDRPGRAQSLTDFVRWIEGTTGVLALAVLVKLGLGTWAWFKVARFRLASARSVGSYLVGWAVTVGLLVIGWITVTIQVFPLRAIICLLLVLLVPLARPALAMAALRANRCAV